MTPLLQQVRPEAIRDHALEEATACDTAADELDRQARELRSHARLLRNLHEVVSREPSRPHLVKDSAP